MNSRDPTSCVKMFFNTKQLLPSKIYTHNKPENPVVCFIMNMANKLVASAVFYIYIVLN